MKDIQKKSAERVQERIGDCEPTNAKAIIWNTFGRNNWRKMHGFPLMRRETGWEDRKLRTSYHNQKRHKEIVKKVLRKQKCL